jgi:hypothetical protein
MSKYWFKPKCCGWGIGLPISWEGWLSMLGLMGVVAALAWKDGFLLPGQRPGPLNFFLFFVETLALAVGFCLAFNSKVEGGVKWRWGKK